MLALGLGGPGLTNSGTVTANGGNGGNGKDVPQYSGNALAGGGGGGGGGGVILLLGPNANSVGGTVTANGGKAGTNSSSSPLYWNATGGGGGGSGGNGGDGATTYPTVTTAQDGKIGYVVRMQGGSLLVY